MLKCGNISDLEWKTNSRKASSTLSAFPNAVDISLKYAKQKGELPAVGIGQKKNSFGYWIVMPCFPENIISADAVVLTDENDGKGISWEKVGPSTMKLQMGAVRCEHDGKYGTMYVGCHPKHGVGMLVSTDNKSWSFCNYDDPYTFVKEQVEVLCSPVPYLGKTGNVWWKSLDRFMDPPSNQFLIEGCTYIRSHMVCHTKESSGWILKPLLSRHERITQDMKFLCTEDILIWEEVNSPITTLPRGAISAKHAGKFGEMYVGRCMNAGVGMVVALDGQNWSIYTHDKPEDFKSHGFQILCRQKKQSGEFSKIFWSEGLFVWDSPVNCKLRITGCSVPDHYVCPTENSSGWILRPFATDEEVVASKMEFLCGVGELVWKKVNSPSTELPLAAIQTTHAGKYGNMYVGRRSDVGVGMVAAPEEGNLFFYTPDKPHDLLEEGFEVLCRIAKIIEGQVPNSTENTVGSKCGNISDVQWSSINPKHMTAQRRQDIYNQGAIRVPPGRLLPKFVVGEVKDSLGNWIIRPFLPKQDTEVDNMMVTKHIHIKIDAYTVLDEATWVRMESTTTAPPQGAVSSEHTGKHGKMYVGWHPKQGVGMVVSSDGNTWSYCSHDKPDNLLKDDFEVLFVPPEFAGKTFHIVWPRTCYNTVPKNSLKVTGCNIPDHFVCLTTDSFHRWILRPFVPDEDDISDSMQWLTVVGELIWKRVDSPAWTLPMGAVRSDKSYVMPGLMGTYIDVVGTRSSYRDGVHGAMYVGRSIETGVGMVVKPGNDLPWCFCTHAEPDELVKRGFEVLCVITPKKKIKRAS